jgi:hypothetical protein
MPPAGISKCKCLAKQGEGTMGAAKSTITVEFEIKSLDPTRSTSNAVLEVQNLEADLQSVVAKSFPTSNVRIRRAEGIPGLPELQHILLHIDWEAVAKGVEISIASFATTEFLTLIKNRVKNLSARQVSSRSAGSSDYDTAKKRATKKSIVNVKRRRAPEKKKK